MTHQDLAELARNLASAIFLVAGVLWIATWRLTAKPVVARRSIATFVLAAGFPGTAAIGPLLHEPSPFAHSAPSTSALFLIPILALLLPGSEWSRQTFARPIPLHYLVVVGWIIGTGLGVVLFARDSLGPDALPAVWRLVCCLSLFAWLLLAFRLSNEGVTQIRSARRGVVLACLLMASAELLRLFAIAGSGPVVGIAPGVQLAAAVVLAVAAGRELRAAYQSTEEGTADLVRTISGLQRQVAALEVADRERLHDARSAVVGVIGASELLGRVPADEEVTRLRSLITQELRRVQSVLDTRGVEPIIDFDLDDALGAVVLSHQLHGHPVIAALDGVTVSGRPRATATVLDNLLRNASVHAPGARVVVRVGTFGRFAAVVVEDDGPGISDADRLRLLGPGVRGAQAGGPGEGLGLHSAFTTMRAQGGSLRLDRREGSGTRVTFTLPLAGGSTISVDRALARGAGAA